MAKGREGAGSSQLHRVAGPPPSCRYVLWQCSSLGGGGGG
eukprot:CAMPEP_0179337102 /NCGR_PEP_ID=MMETSP0797-20121207/67432_1 /TAXON_ID=47934 /ORGANISM="Dinophysis acuminata, Strain DAEP01" /LENGTH=39 /DNA_ID= /DNA_START= /DNA_END= /DNA_ORIENTATION=